MKYTHSVYISYHICVCVFYKTNFFGTPVSPISALYSLEILDTFLSAHNEIFEERIHINFNTTCVVLTAFSCLYIHNPHYLTALLTFLISLHFLFSLSDSKNTTNFLFSSIENSISTAALFFFQFSHLKIQSFLDPLIQRVEKLFNHI